MFRVSVKPPRAIVSDVLAPKPATVAGEAVNVTVRLLPPNVTTSVDPGGDVAQPVQTDALQFPLADSAHAAIAGVETKADRAENTIIVRVRSSAKGGTHHVRRNLDGPEVPQ